NKSVDVIRKVKSLKAVFCDQFCDFHDKLVALIDDNGLHIVCVNFFQNGNDLGLINHILCI
ncbi:hypothetical protein ACJBWN_12165, partial [Streptococcus suis]